MTDDKKTTGKTKIVSLTGLRHDNRTGQTSEQLTDGEIYLKDLGSLIQHLTDVAALDASRAQNNPDKPATRVSSLDSFRTSVPRSSFVVKPSAVSAAEDSDAQSGAGKGGNVRSFPKSSDKPRNK
jgi:hypothetical protein